MFRKQELENANFVLEQEIKWHEGIANATDLFQKGFIVGLQQAQRLIKKLDETS